MAPLRHLWTEVKEKISNVPFGLWLKGAGRTILDTLYPPHSLKDWLREVSDAPQSVGMEAKGWGQIHFLEDEGCRMCAKPFAKGLDWGEAALCQSCEAIPFAFDRARAACVYDDHSKGLILAFKHADRLDLLPMLTRWLERVAKPMKDEINLIVPVPLHPTRLLARRYNQAAELARGLAQALNVECLPDALSRIKPTLSQGHKNRAAREANIKGAFVVPPHHNMRLKGRHVLLVDDVFTTGVTLNACAKALKGAGAESVKVAVLSRVLPKDSL